MFRWLLGNRPTHPFSSWKSYDAERLAKAIDSGEMDANQTEPVGKDFTDAPPIYFCVKGDEEAVKVLLERKADVNAKMYLSRETALHVAAVFDRFRIVEELLRRGAETNAISAKGFTPLDRAAERGCTKSYELLKSAGGVRSGKINYCEICKSPIEVVFWENIAEHHPWEDEYYSESRLEKMRARNKFTFSL